MSSRVSLLSSSLSLSHQVLRSRFQNLIPFVSHRAIRARVLVLVRGDGAPGWPRNNSPSAEVCCEREKCTTQRSAAPHPLIHTTRRCTKSCATNSHIFHTSRWHVRRVCGHEQRGENMRIAQQERIPWAHAHGPWRPRHAHHGTPYTASTRNHWVTPLYPGGLEGLEGTNRVRSKRRSARSWQAWYCYAGARRMG